MRMIVVVVLLFHSVLSAVSLDAGMVRTFQAIVIVLVRHAKQLSVYSYVSSSLVLIFVIIQQP